MNKPTPQQIADAIKASGYLIEQEVATTLESLNFHVQTNRAFEDTDEAKSREIDVSAIQRMHHDPENHNDVFAELICECKNSANPFVFLMRKRTPRDEALTPEEYVFPVGKYSVAILNPLGTPGAKSLRVATAFHHLELAKHNYRYHGDSKAVQFAKIVRNKGKWEAMHERLYDAIFYPLVKALLARRKEARVHASAVWLFFPVVVTSGELYQIDTSPAELKPESVEHVSMARHIKSKAIDGVFNVDFVTQAGLPNFISKIIPFAQRVGEMVKSRPELFRAPPR